MSKLIALIGVACIIAGVALADVRQPIPESTRYTARRGSANMPDPQPTSITECDTRVKAAIATEGRTRTSGSIVYQCITTRSYVVTFGPPPVVPPAVDCVVSEWGAWSDPPWLDCAEGTQSRSIVRTRTIVTQPANGGAACPSLVETQAQTRACPGIARLSWTPPALYSNGDRFTDLRNYRIVYAPTASVLADCAAATTCRSIETPAGPMSSFVVSGLTPGTWYFAVRAVAASGTESFNSNVVSKVVN